MKKSCHPISIIDKYYSKNLQARKILLDHSRLVTRKALSIGRYLQNLGATVDVKFLAEAAMLHDIGMIMTDTPDLHCHGTGDYLQHGIRGKEILEGEGLFKHARVCERHIGIGLTAQEISKKNLPLPVLDMCPETLEEQIICYADLFYSKGIKNRNREKTREEVRDKLAKYGKGKVKIFDQWCKKFEPT
ncbi:HD domain-containing protein [uncultured Desulfuromusa sp.]|uniref:HD domain-containing protein n=1 Tax=uncultured Desulfuromusa sp. TaxID=219183 RepID=UPI002AA7FA74|nr:HD domain-containing protein [uncultured Desulfuromusa sp.]